MLSNSLNAGIDIRFHCVYLLTSLDPRCDGEYYIGYTVNPLRRLRQHNGELVHGARRTSRRGRPWTLVCCVSGFTEDRVALKFEWCWQHPSESARLKHMSVVLPALQPVARRLPYAIAVLHLLLLRAELFARLELTLHIFDKERFDAALAVAQATLQRTTRRVSATQPVGEEASDVTQLPSFSSSSSLLHVEHITTSAFEDKYLSHDRCLQEDTLRSVQTYGEEGGYSGFSRDEDSQLSCPYDLQALSQSVMDASMSPSHVAPRQEQNNSKKSSDAVQPIPRRFCFYGPAEYAAMYMREQRLLKQGRLPCTLCALPLHGIYVMRCPRQPHCGLRAHIACLAMWFDYHSTYNKKINEEKQNTNEMSETSKEDDVAVAEVTLVPMRPCPCPLCGTRLYWASLVRALKQRAAYDLRLTQRERRANMERCWRQRLAKMAAHHGRRRPTRSAPRCGNASYSESLSTTTAARTTTRQADRSTVALTQPCSRLMTTTTMSQLSESSLVDCITHEEARMHTTIAQKEQENNSTIDRTYMAEQAQDDDATLPPNRTALLGLTEFDEEEWLSY